MSSIENFGSESLNQIVHKLKSTSDSRRRYEYVLWLGKTLPNRPEELLIEENKGKGCISEVYVMSNLMDGKLKWRGASDALITRGLLTLLIQGLQDLTPEQVLGIKPDFKLIL